jgi:hypothetical protein
VIEDDLMNLRLIAHTGSVRERILKASMEARNSLRLGRWIRRGVVAAIAVAVTVGILVESAKPAVASNLVKTETHLPAELEWSPDLVTCFRRDLASAPSARLELLPWQP